VNQKRKAFVRFANYGLCFLIASESNASVALKKQSPPLSAEGFSLLSG
jgi:hypothetical protein